MGQKGSKQIDGKVTLSMGVDRNNALSPLSRATARKVKRTI